MTTAALRTLTILLFATSSLVLFASHLIFQHDEIRIGAPQRYSYRGDDYPRTWPLPPLRTARLSHEDSFHYALDTELGIAEWNATLPSGGAVLRLGPDRRPFTLSMFHQLRCLNILRDTLVTLYHDRSAGMGPGRTRLAEHCMNYLRQTVICRADLRLESVRAASGPQVTVSDITHTCKDWTAVYGAAEDNYERYLVAVGERNG
ncbi:hypothetical protein TRAPUB_2498 [Trametes pubescens]|uniref:Oxidase ustYa n=1 Tax=Trametes pubescens TaxID=154538 RepID=A0A1M2VGB7_TRAPU|nr:hypothetical protein TRAPUB_2498 [Trametes pubescens]